MDEKRNILWVDVPKPFETFQSQSTETIQFLTSGRRRRLGWAEDGLLLLLHDGTLQWINAHRELLGVLQEKSL